MRQARRKPLFEPPPFLRSARAAVAFLKSNRAVMDIFMDMWPSEWSEPDRIRTVENELRQVAWDYMERARTIIDSGSVTLFRAIRIPAKGGLHNINWDCLGKSWSAEFGGADVYGEAPFESDCLRDVVLIGTTGPQHIDWKYGFESFAIYGKDQWEISLLPHSPVLVREVVVRPTVCGLSPTSSTYSVYGTGRPGERRVLSQPIRGSTGPTQEVWFEGCKEVRGRPRPLTPKEATLEGLMALPRTCQPYQVFETRGGVDFLVTEVEASSGLDALVEGIAPSVLQNMTFCGITESADKTTCIVRFRSKYTNIARTWYARPTG